MVDLAKKAGFSYFGLANTKTEYSLQTDIFKPSETEPVRLYLFKNSEPGRLRDALPLSELAVQLPDRCEGRPSWFDNEGMLAPMFLKSYSGLSDQKLIERFNFD